MDIQFGDPDLDRLETDARFTARKSQALVKAFRKRIQGIRAAKDERDLRAVKSWRFEKMEGARSHQYSIRLNDQLSPNPPMDGVRKAEGGVRELQGK